MPVCVVGAFPPPTHGMSLVNERMCEELARFDSVRKIDISPGIKVGAISKKLSRIGSVLDGLLSFIRSHKDFNSVYIGLSGGFGQIHELAFVLLARVTHKRIFIHHHSYAYIDKFSRIFRSLVFLAGPACTQIVLSELMGERIRLVYPGIKKLVVVPNSAFIKPKDAHSKRIGRPICVGFLSNISFEKGIKLFFETLNIFQKSDICFTAKVAGPYATLEVQKFVEKKLQEFPSVKYLGSVDEKGKESFFSSIDILLFPTLYRNEAQPLIIFEALASAVPVVALDRGSISETINCKNGLLVENPDDFSNQSVSFVQRLNSQDSLFRKISQDTQDEFRLDHNKALYDLRSLACRITKNDSSIVC